ASRERALPRGAGARERRAGRPGRHARVRFGWAGRRGLADGRGGRSGGGGAGSEPCRSAWPDHRKRRTFGAEGGASPGRARLTPGRTGRGRPPGGGRDAGRCQRRPGPARDDRRRRRDGLMRTLEPWVAAPLEEFLAESSARLVLLMTSAGQVVAQHGFTRSLDVMAAAALGAG